MFDTLITLGLIGGAGYLGFRLGKGGSVLKLNPVDVQNVRRKAATQDMTLVRKQGEIGIADTREGVVYLQYDRGTYTISRPVARGGVIVLAQGSSNEVRPVLESLYDVVVEAP